MKPINIPQDIEPADGGEYESAMADGNLVEAAEVSQRASILKALQVTTGKTSDHYVQLHDAAAEPEDGAVPKKVWLMPAKATFETQIETPCASGIWIVSSSTLATLTKDGNNLFINARYL